ncbi:hypothetical protein QN277_001116 [Acacia crassicarpa]|uniref:F-box domain-containing protein n=1 Tax=Acacia crassicarpa TaxID=499986 RepID=A0AAE1N7R3_9FABA|nr:hypothetical protein QN277_001116 [Acacia crassicarpa]
MENLPNELRTEILFHLPIKSLVRLKCVSKSWLSLISNPNFPKLHFQRSPQHYTHRFPYIVVSHHQRMRAIDFRMRAIDFSVSPRDDSAAISFDYPSDYNEFMLASCRGFLLLIHKEKRDKLLVWNPLTGERKQILLPKTQMNFELNGFCYDESTDDYFIVLVSFIVGPAFRIFSIRNNSWNKEFVINRPETMAPNNPLVSGLVVNGVIYWKVSFTEEQGIPKVNILALDIKTNQVRRVVPNINDIDLALCNLRLLGESLALVDLAYYEVITVWVMKEGEGESSWTKHMSVPRSREASPMGSPICFTKDGQLVTLLCLTFLRWSSQQGKLEEVGKLEEDRTYGYPVYSHYAPVYTETLLSLPPTQNA